MTRIASLRRLAIANTRIRPTKRPSPGPRGRDSGSEPEPSPVAPGPVPPTLGGGATATVD